MRYELSLSRALSPKVLLQLFEEAVHAFVDSASLASVRRPTRCMPLSFHLRRSVNLIMDILRMVVSMVSVMLLLRVIIIRIAANWLLL